MMHRTLIGVTIVTLALAGMTGCATRSSSGAVYSSDQTQREQVVRMGTVESVRAVTIEREKTGVGAATGTIVGGVAGSNVGGGKGAVVGTVIGAVAGGIAGQAIEGSANKRAGLEITVRLDSGEMRAIVQEADENFAPGQRVRLLSRDGVTRVTH